MNEMQQFWDEHGTKVLGAAVAVKDIIGVALAIDGLVPLAALKWFLFINGVLGIVIVRRGFTNTAKAASKTDQQSGV